MTSAPRKNMSEHQSSPLGMTGLAYVMLPAEHQQQTMLLAILHLTAATADLERAEKYPKSAS